MRFYKGLIKDELPTKIKLREDYEVLQKVVMEGEKLNLENLSMPPTGPKAEKASFKTHMDIAVGYKDYINDTKIPASLETIKRFSAEVGGMFNKKNFEFNWRDFLSHVWTEMNNTKMDSSPGVPYAYVYKDNKSFFEADRVAVFNMVVARWFARLQVYENIRKGKQYTPEELVEANVCDPVRIFIKREPHKKEKIDNERHRIIYSMDVISAICDRLCYWPDKIHIANWPAVPMKPGTPLGTPYGDQTLCEDILESGALIESHDKKHFDLLIRWARWKGVALVRAAWAISEEELEKLYENIWSSDNVYVRQIVMGLYAQMFKVVVFSDGMAAVTEGFYETSGSAGTASNNSLDNALNHFEFCYRNNVSPYPCAFYGDDTVQPYHDGEAEYLAKLGILVKPGSVMRSKDQFEFCSRLYSRTPEGYSMKFLGVRKTLYNWLCNTPSLERNLAVVKELGPIGVQLQNLLPTLKGIG